MSAGSGNPGTQSAAGQRSPEEIQAEIEQTREELGETVAEIADKADVKKQAKRKVNETKAKVAAKKDEVKQRAAAQKEAAGVKLKKVAPEPAQEGAQQAAQTPHQVTGRASQAARENPVPTAALGAFVAGLAIGLMLGRR